MKPGMFVFGTLLFWSACSITLGDDLLEERTERYALGPGSSLEIENVNGDVSIESWNGSDVEVTLSIYGDSSRGIPDGFAIEVSPGTESLAYEVRYPDGENMSVRFLVRVPEGLSLDAHVEVVNGGISIAGPHMVDVEAVNGTISIEGATGGAGAETTNGNITASFRSVSAGMELSSVNGSIRAAIPETVGFTAETVNGSVETVGITTTSSTGISVTAGGDSPLAIETVNGSITVETL